MKQADEKGQPLTYWGGLVDDNFNEVSKEILKSIQLAKQASLLDKSLVKCYHSLTKEVIESPNIDHDSLVKYELRQRLSKEIIGVTQQHIKTEDYRDARVYSLELLIFPLEDLKHILEYCVKNMSMDEINKIKNR